MAARCLAFGIGRVVDPSGCTHEAVREAVSDVLSDPQYRANSRRLQGVMAALPGPETWIGVLEGFARRISGNWNTV